jgi:hypothetical protein
VNKDEWLKAFAGLTPAAGRLALGFMAFDPKFPDPTKARLAMWGMVLGLPEAQVHAALTELVKAGLASEVWLD